MWGDIMIAFSIAFMTAFMATPYTIKLAKRLGAVDNPNDERRINKVVMPRLGGVAVISGFVVSMLYLLIVLSIEDSIDLNKEYYLEKLIGFAAGGLVIISVCFIDDTRGVPALVKLLAQILAASIAVYFGIRIENINIPFLGISSNKVIDIIITYGWIIGITNAMNLIDGLDGLSTGISIISCFSLLIIFASNNSPIISILLITALVGALVGFLPYNFNPARTFIGDTGSNFLGYCLSIISIFGIAKTYTAIVIVAPIIVLGLPIFDTIFAIFRRLKKGKSLKAIVEPDAGHLHHRMLKKGFTQKQAVLILYGFSAILGIFAIIWIESGIWKALSFAIIMLLIILMGYKEFFKQKLLVKPNENNKEEIDNSDK